MVSPVVWRCRRNDLGAARFWSAGAFEPFNNLTGQRVLRRKTIIPFLAKMRNLGYGVELFLNKQYDGKPVKTVRLPHVFILGKLEKQTLPDALLSYIKEIRELLTQLVTQYADEIGPHAKHIFREVIRYISRMLDAFTA